MAPALALRRVLGRKQASSICVFCSLSAIPRRPSRLLPLILPAAAALKLNNPPRRFQSTESLEDPYSYNRLSPVQLRAELASRLQELQTQFPNTLEPNRLKLALRSLSEPPGEESIRIAIFVPEPHSETTDATAKQLVRAVLADELSPEAEWERQLAEHDLQHNPLVIRVQPTTDEQQSKKDVTSATIPEIVATSPTLGRLGLELLISRVKGEDFLVSKVHIHGSEEIDLDGVRDSMVITPFHSTLVVTKGLQGALQAYQTSSDSNFTQHAVDFKSPLSKEDIIDTSHLHFIPVNIEAVTKGLEAMRAGDVDLFKNKWLQGNASTIRDWLKQKCVEEDGSEKTKPAVKGLVQSLLQNAASSVPVIKQNSTPVVTQRNTENLQTSLKEWAESAHAELQTQLTVASTKRSWKKLSWWKLFWRADDVGRIASDMVSEHFLFESEKNIIFLSGQINQALNLSLPQKWPTQIPDTRNLILKETVPALQSLAQKLVIRSAGISGLSAGLAGLSYVYAPAGAYECGSIAALGVILSFWQIQRRWERAQRCWEDEVREEGRKAIRGTEGSMRGLLKGGEEGGTVDKERKRGEEEGKRAREILERVGEVLKRV